VLVLGRYLQRELELIASGAMDAKLEEIMKRPLPAEYADLEEFCDWPEPPKLPPIVLREVMEGVESADEQEGEEEDEGEAVKEPQTPTRQTRASRRTSTRQKTQQGVH
jgi:hypothetical protein